MYLVDLSNIKQNDVEIEENKEDNRNKFESNNLNANYNIKQTSFY
jgi:hypothetical protein